MKMNIAASVAIFAVLIITAGCRHTEGSYAKDPSLPSLAGGEGMFPMRSIEVTSIDDLGSGNFRILGTVEGKGDVDAFDPSDGDTFRYGTLELDESARMYYPVDMARTDAYGISLKNAVHELIVDARSVGATFLTFPNYTVEYTPEDRIVTIVNAVAVQLVESDVQGETPQDAT